MNKCFDCSSCQIGYVTPDGDEYCEWIEVLNPTECPLHNDSAESIEF